MEKDGQPGGSAPMADGVERSDPRRAAMSRDTRILFRTLVVGFLGVIVTGSIGVYSENRADQRAVVGLELSQVLSRFDELSRNQTQIRDEVAAGFAAAAADRAAIRDEVAAGFAAAAADRAAIRDEAATDRAAIRDEVAAGFAAAAADRAAIRDEAAADRAAIRDEAAADRAAIRDEAAADRAAIRDEAAADRAAIRDEAATERAAIRDEAAADRAAIRDEAAADRAAIRDALREQGDTVLLATLCLIDLVRQWPATGPSETGAPDARSALGSASCDRLERLAAVR